MRARPFIMLFLVCLSCQISPGCTGQTDTSKQAPPKPAETAVPPVSRDSAVIGQAGKDSVKPPAERGTAVTKVTDKGSALPPVSRESVITKPAGKDSVMAPDSRDSVVIEVAGKDSVSAFDLLRRSHAVCYQSTLSGVFVKQIDLVKSGTSAFWIYSVNDTMPNVASDRMLTRTGDRVKWHFRRMGK